MWFLRGDLFLVISGSNSDWVQVLVIRYEWEEWIEKCYFNEYTGCLDDKTWYNIHRTEKNIIDVMDKSIEERCPTDPFTILKTENPEIDRQTLCGSETSVDGFWGSKMMKGLVGLRWPGFVVTKLHQSKVTTQMKLDYNTHKYYYFDNLSLPSFIYNRNIRNTSRESYPD